MTKKSEHSIRAHRMIVLGLNHNVPHRGRVFHVQTEVTQETSAGVRRVDTHVFDDGHVVARYTTNVGAEMTRSRDVVRVMKSQHRQAIRGLLVGARPTPTGDTGRGTARAPPREARPATPPSPRGEFADWSPRSQRALRALERLTMTRPDEHALLPRLRQIGTALAVLRSLDELHDTGERFIQSLISHQHDLIQWLKGLDGFPESRGQELYADSLNLCTLLTCRLTRIDTPSTQSNVE